MRYKEFHNSFQDAKDDRRIALARQLNLTHKGWGYYVDPHGDKFEWNERLGKYIEKEDFEDSIDPEKSLNLLNSLKNKSLEIVNNSPVLDKFGIKTGIQKEILKVKVLNFDSDSVRLEYQSGEYDGSIFKVPIKDFVKRIKR